jgi:hypothetical protein
LIQLRPTHATDAAKKQHRFGGLATSCITSPQVVNHPEAKKQNMCLKLYISVF